ncbi:MAG: hypothetical protein ACRD9L_00735, partial [Bryobacteraceae bacterium]
MAQSALLKNPAPPIERLVRSSVVRGAAFAVALLWMNIYICREMFLRYTPHMNSMQGFWVALSQRGGASLFHPDWWRFWDCGSPVELVYAPLIPALTALVSALRGVPADVAFQTVSGSFYCLAPLTLFIMAWRMTRAPGCSFAAAAFYSLAAPTQWIVPDAGFSMRSIWDARRFYLMSVWDETPHVAALAILPLSILFLWLSLHKRRPVYYALAAFTIALSALASDFGPVITAMAALPLLFTVRSPEEPGLLRNVLLVAAIGLFSYALCAPFLSPANLVAIHAASTYGSDAWNMGSLTALAITACGWALLWQYLPRCTSDWRLRFFALFAWLTGSVPLISAWLGRHYLPQPDRYKIEMEFSLALLLAFAARPLLHRIPRPLRACVLLLLISLAGEQIAAHRRFAKAVLAPADITRTIEYRASTWASTHIPDVRIMLPGSIAQWADAFTNLQQFGGGSWSVAYNQAQQTALRGIWNGGDTPERDAQVSIAWLKAFGVGAIAVSGPRSQETWKPFRHPAKFDGILPVLWTSDDVTIYRVPLLTASLAHVMSESALPRRAPSNVQDIADVANYVAALDNPALPS